MVLKTFQRMNQGQRTEKATTRMIRRTDQIQVVKRKRNPSPSPKTTRRKVPNIRLIRTKVIC